MRLSGPLNWTSCNCPVKEYKRMDLAWVIPDKMQRPSGETDLSNSVTRTHCNASPYRPAESERPMNYCIGSRNAGCIQANKYDSIPMACRAKFANQATTVISVHPPPTEVDRNTIRNCRWHGAMQTQSNDRLRPYNLPTCGPVRMVGRQHVESPLWTPRNSRDCMYRGRLRLLLKSRK